MATAMLLGVAGRRMLTNTAFTQGRVGIPLAWSLAQSSGLRQSRFYSAQAAREEVGEAKLFDKILIANRGEIACRVMRTCKKFGIKTVAIYSEADRHSMHVKMADEAYCVGPAPSAESYLNREKIVEVIHRSGAQAVHPGYGFMSENADFADLLKKEGIEFIGPPSSAIRSMGSKSESKKIMSAANVPIIEGYHGEDQNLETLQKEAERIGYPVMIKAVLGGGGKGMRIVESADKFQEMLEAAKREAMKSFSDDVVLIEKYVSRPRHVEVQVFADKHGNTVHLFERDCSVQRRHQKIIEEAPAPHLSEKTRQEIGMAAVRAAEAVNYVGAGTVEFIMDAQENFYFMEMNTRLQVEHPVTEYITGVDLVEWQVRAASGFPLEIKQEDIKINGHSFEARIYAEDPDNQFLPAAGPLKHLATPEPVREVRVETGVRQGDEVTVYYDPMIAKLVVHGIDRQQALRKLIDCLDQYHVVGLPTNIEFLKVIAKHPAFIRGDVETGFIPNYEKELFPEQPPFPDPDSVAQAVVGFLNAERLATNWDYPYAQHDATSPWNKSSSFRPNRPFKHTISLEHPAGDVDVNITRSDYDHYEIAYVDPVTKQTHDFPVVGSVSDNEIGAMSLQCGDRGSDAKVVMDGDTIYVFNKHSAHKFNVPQPKYVGLLSHAVDMDSILAPMTGKIEKILVEEGAVVEKETPLVLLEAMKMEHTLRAPISGKVEKVNFKSGDLVNQNAVIIKFEQTEE
eukprot:Clim_evm98s109 gene=Clim_evmTU98s109